MIKKKAKQSKPSCYFKVVFFLSFLREKKKKKKIIQNIYIFTIKSPENFLERGQGLKINIKLIDQFK